MGKTVDAKVTSRYDIIGKATYALRDMGTGQVLTTGTVDNFHQLLPPPARTVSERWPPKPTRYERLMVILADRIVTRPAGLRRILWHAMKLSSRDAEPLFCQTRSRPDAGLLIYGPDAMRIALKRQEVIAALIGPQGEEEMRLTRIPAGAELRKDPAMPGRRDQGGQLFPRPPRRLCRGGHRSCAAHAILAALEDWAPR